MIRFLDGPAEGVKLELRFAPDMLRVVRAPGDIWDALDMPGDQPALDEEVFLYRRVTQVSMMHIDYIDRRAGRAAKTIARADYRFAGSPEDKS